MSLFRSRRCAAIALGLMALGALYAVYLAGQRRTLSEPEVSSPYQNDETAGLARNCRWSTWSLGKASSYAMHAGSGIRPLCAYLLLLRLQAALKALERWVAAEGAAVGADPAALQSISAALAKQHTAAQQLSVRPAATRRSKRKRRIRKKAALTPEIAARCVGTVGDWCGEYFLQKPIPGKVRLGSISSTRAKVSMDLAVQLSL